MPNKFLAYDRIVVEASKKKYSDRMFLYEDGPINLLVTGTADNATESQIVAGGRTIILDLLGDTWLASGAPFDGQRQAIIDGLSTAIGDTGFVFPGTAVGNRVITGGDVNWVSVDNIKVDDTSTAKFQPTGLEQSNGLAATNFDFSSIPDDVQIDGIEIQVGDFKHNVSSPAWNVLRLVLADDSDGSENKNGELIAWTGSDQTDQAGGTSDLWSETISVADVKDSDFGFFVGVEGDGAGSAMEIDFMQMRVYFSALFKWNIKIRDTMGVAQVVRTSSTKVTITILAAEAADYKIVANEAVTVTVPASALTTSVIALVGSNQVNITAECDQTLPPDTIATQTNLTGAVTDIDESVDSPDANWLTLNPP